MIILLDTTVLIDAIRRRNVATFHDLVERRNVLAASVVSVGEVYADIRPAEVERTEALLARLDCYPVTASIARVGGSLVNSWAHQGRTLKLADMLIAATAIEHGIPLMTSNRKDFPMPELRFYPN